MPSGKQFVVKVSLAIDSLTLANTVTSFALNEVTNCHNYLK